MSDLPKFDPLMVLACLEIVQQYCDQHNACRGCLFYNEDCGCGFAPCYEPAQPHEWKIKRFNKNLMRNVRKKFEAEEE